MRNQLPFALVDRPRSNAFRDFDHVFDAFFAPTRSAAFVPQIDVEETDGAFLLSFDVPGVKPEDISVEVSDGSLRVSGERRRDERDSTIGRKERSFGRFERVFDLPRGVDASKIEARQTNGVLELTLPKSESARSRLIPVNVKE